MPSGTWNTSESLRRRWIWRISETGWMTTTPLSLAICLTGCGRTGAESTEWALLGNAFVQFAEDTAGLLTRTAISRSEAALYAAAAFYSGGFRFGVSQRPPCTADLLPKAHWLHAMTFSRDQPSRFRRRLPTCSPQSVKTIRRLSPK